MKQQKTFLDRGNLSKGEGSAPYSFPSSSDFFSPATNSIPFLSSVSGSRVYIGDKSLLQAVSLVHREPPLVHSIGAKGSRSFADIIGHDLGVVKAERPGTVLSVTDDTIVVKEASGPKAYPLYTDHNIGRKSFLHNTIIVKVGDHVKTGQVLASSNFTDDKGHMALGVNLKTAVMPYRSGNFEDAIVITESGAKKLEAEQLIKERVEKRFGVETNKSKFISLFPNKFTNEQLSKIDEDGALKKGAVVKYGDPIILSFSPKILKSTDMQLGKLSKAMKHAFKDNTLTWDYEHSGVALEVAKAGDLITVNIKTQRSLQVGDKISSAFGAKGVCAMIVPDSQAPTGEDGKPVDQIINSMSITSRVAPGLPLAMAMGKLAQKLGRPVKVKHFLPDSAVDKTMATLKKHGLKDMETLYDPVTGKHIQALTGPLYSTRLTHIAEDKVSDRGQGGGYDWAMQPTKSKEESAKRVGNLGTAALLSSGATAVLEDIATIRATKNDDYWRRTKLGQPIPTPKSPFVFDKFLSMLSGAGVKVDRKGDVFGILPQTDKDVTLVSAGAIDNALTFKVKKDQLVPEKGGLFDPSKVGVLGERYTHIDLNMPVPAPISEEFLRKLLKVTQKQYEDLIISGEISKKLEGLNLDKEIETQARYLRSGKKSDRNNAVKILSFLKTLKKNDLQPKDLMLHKIPVIPAQYRPIAMQGNLILPSDVNLLYKDLILNNQALKKLSSAPEEIQRKVKAGQYQAVKAVFGLDQPISIKNREKGIKGLLASAIGLQGGSGKRSMFQSRVVNKPVDLVGRAVLTPDASLDMDEVSLPQDVVWKTFKPFVMRNMVQRGIPATKADEYIDHKNPLARQALMEVLPHRPVIISRDPALHKFSLSGFYVRPNIDPRDKTIKLNPLVFKPFGADNDGDQLNAQIPAGEAARLDVIEKMLPSQNLLSPATFKPAFVPLNESALGLFQASMEDKNNKPIHFKSVEDVVRAFKAGKLSVDDRVEVG